MIDKFNWVVRNEVGQLEVWLEKPIKFDHLANGRGYWDYLDSLNFMKIAEEDMFSNVRWSDEEPTELDNKLWSLYNDPDE
jgi:hypothetical protein